MNRPLGLTGAGYDSGLRADAYTSAYRAVVGLFGLRGIFHCI